MLERSRTVALFFPELVEQFQLVGLGGIHRLASLESNLSCEVILMAYHAQKVVDPRVEWVGPDGLEGGTSEVKTVGDGLLRNHEPSSTIITKHNMVDRIYNFGLL